MQRCVTKWSFFADALGKKCYLRRNPIATLAYE
ncbi:hypothetical protein ACVW0Y_004553 [Pseudomonas sp. TE3786]